MNLYPDEGVGVYLVINSTGRNGAAAALPASFMSGFSDRYFPEPAIESAVGAAAAAAHARQMAGMYMSSRGQESNFFSALGFLTQVKVGLDEDGGLLVPALLDARGEPMKWREVRPYVWQQVGGKERLAARVEGGRIEMFSVDSVSPFLVMLPAPWWKSTAIFGPSLVAAIAVILASLLAWPVSAMLRRHYGLWPANAGTPGLSYRLSRIAAAGALATLAGWAALFAQLNGNIFAFSLALDPWIVLLKVSTAILCGGGMAVAAWDACRGWSGRSWATRGWSLLLALAFVILLWLAPSSSSRASGRITERPRAPARGTAAVRRLGVWSRGSRASPSHKSAGPARPDSVRDRSRYRPTTSVPPGIQQEPLEIGIGGLIAGSNDQCEPARAISALPSGPSLKCARNSASCASSRSAGCPSRNRTHSCGSQSFTGSLSIAIRPARQSSAARSTASNTPVGTAASSPACRGHRSTRRFRLP